MKSNLLLIIFVTTSFLLQINPLHADTSTYVKPKSEKRLNTATHSSYTQSKKDACKKNGNNYKIGDIGPAGGWVFFVNEDCSHGLETAPYDQAVNIQWFNGENTNTEAHGDGIGAGEMNTMLIVANQGSDSKSYAAGICANLVINHEGIDYGDWYLPSRYELNLMYENLHANGIGDFIDFTYWSSTEWLDVNAYFQDFSSGLQGAFVKYARISVRAIRRF